MTIHPLVIYGHFRLHSLQWISHDGWDLSGFDLRVSKTTLSSWKICITAFHASYASYDDVLTHSTERTKVMIKLYAIIHIYVNDYETRRTQTSVLMIVVKWPEVKPRSTHSSYQYWFRTSDEVNTSIMIMIHISYHRIFLYRFDMITYS